MDEPRARLLDAAGPVFAEKGFDSATVREICHAADVNVAAVNYYFGDKERLYIESVKRASCLRATEFPFPAWNTGTPPEQKLRDFIRTLLMRMLGDDRAPWEARLMLREILHPSAACRELAEEYFRPQFDILIGILNELVPENTPGHTCRQIGYSVIGQCVFYRVCGEVVSMLTPQHEYDQHYGLDELAGHISSFSLAGITSMFGSQRPLPSGFPRALDAQ